MNDENDPAHVPLTPHEAWRLAIDAARATWILALEAADAEREIACDAANAVYALATARELTEQEKKDQ